MCRNRFLLPALLGIGMLLMLAAPGFSAPQKVGQIDGSVPGVEYDVQRLYTMIVVPTNHSSDSMSQAVIQEFGGDPVIRENTITKISVADAGFSERWGSSFSEAAAGKPTVAVIQENGSEAKCLYKMPITSAKEMKSERIRCRQIILNNGRGCVDCLKKPKPPATPAVNPGGGNAPPALPPIANTPAEEEEGLVAKEDEPNMALVLGVCVVMGGVVLIGMGAIRS
jgi:hypothetical protein